MRSFLDRIRKVWKGHPGQEEFLLAEAHTKVLACGRRWGKTDACAVQVLHGLFGRAPTRQLLLAPTFAQALIPFDRIVALLSEILGLEEARERIRGLRRSPFASFRYLSHLVSARSGHVGRSLRGHDATHVVVDEAAYVPESLISEVAAPMLATNDGTMTLISTPNGRNHFWRYFQFGMAREHGCWSRQAPSSESPRVSRSFLEIQKEMVGERAYRVEYEAEFLDAAGQVFPAEAIDRCVVQSVSDLILPTYAIGIDFGRYRDWSAIAVLSGNRKHAVLAEIVRIPRGSWETQRAAICEVLGRYPSAGVFADATGVGDPIVEQLNSTLGRAWVEGLVFSARSKSQIIDRLASMFHRGALKMAPDPLLLRELQFYEAVVGPHGGVRYGASAGYHDDLVTALALAAERLPAPGGIRIISGARRAFDTIHQL